MTTSYAPLPVGVTAQAPAVRRGRLARVLRGAPEDPRWARPGLLVLLALTAGLYLWDLSASGWANAFYSAAVQAGTQSWKAFFFGSSDASNFITVDKPPASLWVMELSARIFGVNSWSILVPEALLGVATAGVLYATVKRWFGAGAGLLAGAVVTLTPVAALMFRFNNPDALLVLLLTAGAYAVTRAIEDGRTRWLVLAGVVVGTGFITKMLQAYLVLPAFVVAYLVAGPHPLGRRIRQLLASAVALAVATLWWPVAVSLVPAANRPYVGGSQDNSIWNLIFGYNGFGRLTGNETGSVGGGGNGGGMWGPTGWNRLFTSQFGSQISWLIPAALILLVGALVLHHGAPRTDRTRAALVLWGGWLLVTGLTFSYASGIIHPYYAVALAPAIGATVGIGGVVLWRRRELVAVRGVLAASVAVTAIWAYVLLHRSAGWHPWVRNVVLVGGLLAAVGILAAPTLRGRWAAGVAGLALASGLLAPLGYTLNTVTTAHTGSIPSAGPAATGGFGGRGGPGGGFAGRGGFRGFGVPGGPGAANGGNGATAPNGMGRNGFGGNAAPGGGPPGGFGGGGFGGGGFGGGGGLLNAGAVGSSLATLLEADASDYTWVAATTGANNAAGYQLATGKPVMAIGGFNGTDPAPTLAQFEAYVTAGKIHYYLGGSTGAGRAGASGEIASWVAAHFTATTVDGVTVYDLSASSSG